MKQLKIVEQIIIVLIISVFIPFITIGIIISNVSQQSIRSQLERNTLLIAKLLADNYENYVEFSQAQLDQMASGFNYIPGTMAKLQYFDEIEAKTKLFKNLDIIEKDKLPKQNYEVTAGKLNLISSIDKEQNYYLSARIDVDILDTLLGKENLKGRNIYVFDSKTNELILSNAPKTTAMDALVGLSLKDKEDNLNNAILFGNKKNTPKAFYKLTSPDWYIIVDTTTKVTARTITKAHNRIILSLCIAALSIIIIVSLYTYYLYINIRQLFKGITAISKGNYDKKIHLIKRAFTPHEVVFLAKEFNYMAKKINVSYRDLKKKNKKLKQLNEFRENLVSSTSHEFRTPLTSIIGYSSRLLRQDIKLDDEMKTKSLQIIKQQAQRLSRMVDDLLVIPELESYSLKYNIEEVDLSSSILLVIDYLNKEEIELQSDISSDLNYIYADKYRLEQVIINLVDNAMKYSLDNQPVKIEAYNETTDKGNVPILKISNKCEEISDEVKEHIFEKFIRADSNLTRTTRGTGLGLYIVKGLCEAMQIGIDLKITDEFIMTLRFNDYVR